MTIEETLLVQFPNVCQFFRSFKKCGNWLSSSLLKVWGSKWQCIWTGHFKNALVPLDQIPSKLLKTFAQNSPRNLKFETWVPYSTLHNSLKGTEMSLYWKKKVESNSFLQVFENVGIEEVKKKLFIWTGP